MNTILVTIFIVLIVSLLYFFFSYYTKTQLHSLFIGKENTLQKTLTFFLSLIIVTIIYYYIIPYFFKYNDEIVAYLTIYTVTNFSALFLSWLYFNRTHCWRDEANHIAKKMYFIVGEDIGHIIMLILRIGINIVIAKLLLTGELQLEPETYDGVKTVTLFYSFLCAIYTSELLSNIISNFSSEIVICKNTNYFCKTYNMFCDHIK